MDRSLLLIPALVLSSGLIGCTQQPASQQDSAPPFVFRSLDLNQRRKDGQRGLGSQQP